VAGLRNVPPRYERLTEASLDLSLNGCQTARGFTRGASTDDVATTAPPPSRIVQRGGRSVSRTTCALSVEACGGCRAGRPLRKMKMPALTRPSSKLAGAGVLDSDDSPPRGRFAPHHTAVHRRPVPDNRQSVAGRSRSLQVLREKLKVSGGERNVRRREWHTPGWGGIPGRRAAKEAQPAHGAGRA